MRATLMSFVVGFAITTSFVWTPFALPAEPAEPHEEIAAARLVQALTEGTVLPGTIRQRGFGVYDVRLVVETGAGESASGVLYLDSIRNGGRQFPFGAEMVVDIVPAKANQLEFTVTDIRRQPADPRMRLPASNVGTVYRGRRYGKRLKGAIHMGRDAKPGTNTFTFTLPESVINPPDDALEDVIRPDSIVQDGSGDRNAQGFNAVAQQSAPEFASTEKRPVSDRELIQGRWRVTSLRKDGRDEDLGKASDDVYTFEGDTLRVETVEFPPTEMPIVLNETVEPRELDATTTITGTEQLSRMLYSLSGDTLTVCYPRPGEPRPTELKTTPGDGRTLIVMQRIDPSLADTRISQPVAVHQSDEPVLQRAVKLYQGVGIVPDLKAAKVLFEQAFNEGGVLARMWKARCLHTGRCEFPKDEQAGQELAREVIAEVKRMAHEGDVEAQFLLGSAYEDGLAVEPDAAASISWYAKAADGGHSVAIWNLAYHAARQGDHDQAAMYLTRAAEGGDVVAMNDLGVSYSAGKGVPKNNEMAMKWYRKAADLGLPLGMLNTGGLFEIQGDWDQAFHWYKKAAQAGQPDGMHNLAVCYFHGYGVARDRELADEWLHKAAAAGSDASKKALAAAKRAQLSGFLYYPPANDSEDAYQSVMQEVERDMRQYRSQYNPLLPPGIGF